jgi:predicted metal-dependent HD superfamily phosphohydrolase
MSKFDYRNFLVYKGITFFPDQYYNSNHVYYHTLEHAENVIQEIYEYYLTSKGTKHLQETYLFYIIMAALWHDSVYVVGYPEGMNEELSAYALESAVYQNKNFCFDIEVITNMIKQTSIKDHMNISKNSIQNVLLDADLASLGKDWNTFYNNNISIMKEHNISCFSFSTMKPQAEFLKKLMDSRKTIYRTKYFIDKYEKQARMNINKLCELTGVNCV